MGDGSSSNASVPLPRRDESPAGDEEAEPEPASTRVVNQRPNAAPSRLDALAMAEAKSLKSAQLEKQRTTGKTLSSKALKRTNNSRHAEVGKRANSKRTNFPIKMAGNRNLKQC